MCAVHMMYYILFQYSGNAYRYALIIKQTRIMPKDIPRPLMLLNPTMGLSVHLLEYIVPDEDMVSVAHANPHDVLPCRIMHLNKCDGSVHAFSELFPIPCENSLYEYNATELSFLNQYFNKVVLMCTTVKIIYLKCYLEFCYLRYQEVSQNKEQIQFLLHPTDSKFPTELCIVFEISNNSCEIIVSVDRISGEYVLFTNNLIIEKPDLDPDTRNSCKKYLDMLHSELNSELHFMHKVRNCLYDYFNNTTSDVASNSSIANTKVYADSRSVLIRHITLLISNTEKQLLYNPNTATIPIAIDDVCNTMLWSLLKIYDVHSKATYGTYSEHAENI